MPNLLHKKKSSLNKAEKQLQLQQQQQQSQQNTHQKVQETLSSTALLENVNINQLVPYRNGDDDENDDDEEDDSSISNHMHRNNQKKNLSYPSKKVGAADSFSGGNSIFYNTGGRLR